MKTTDQDDAGGWRTGERESCRTTERRWSRRIERRQKKETVNDVFI
jgi:hypothetical protein